MLFALFFKIMPKSIFDFAERVKKNSTQEILNNLSIDIQRDNTIQNIQKSQWDKGEDINGNVLGIYTKATEIISGGRKRAEEPYDLDDTGAFRKGVYTDIRPTVDNLDIEVNSTDDKTAKLIYEIGPQIFGIQNDNIRKVSELTKNKFINILNKIIQ